MSDPFIGEEQQLLESFTWFALFSFDTEGFVAGDTYRLFVTEQSREGTPFQDLGKVLIEYIDKDDRFPGRFGEAMNLLGSFTEAEFFAAGGIDIAEKVNEVLSGPHSRYLYLRFRFENCTDGDADTERTQITTDSASNPDQAVRIVQGSTVKKIYFAQFGDGTAGPSTLFSQLVLVNLDPTNSANVTVRLKQPDGSAMTVDLNGTVVNGESQIVIPVGGTVVLATDGLGTLQRGSVTVCSDVPVAGVVLFGGSVGFAGVGNSVPLKKIVAPIQAETPGVNTGLAIMGLGVPQTLKVELFDELGQSLAKAELTFATGEEQDARFVDQFIWGTPVDFSNFTRSLVVCGDADFGAVVILVRPEQFATLPVTQKAAVNP